LGTLLSAAARTPDVPADAAQCHSTAPSGPVVEKLGGRAGRSVGSPSVQEEIC